MALKLVVGLGNPEPRYERTRHNAGFNVVARLAIKYGASFATKKDLKCELAKFSTKAGEVLAVRPLTYMNLSGGAVGAVLRFFKLMPEALLVIHDDVALPLGIIRFQNGGGAGGQHGVESIISELGGNKNFDRLKVGVGPDPGGDRRADYVLSAPPQEQEELYARVLLLAAEAIEVWQRDGVQTAMNRYNGRDLRPDAVNSGQQ